MLERFSSHQVQMGPALLLRNCITESTKCVCTKRQASALLGFADGPLLRYLMLSARAEHLIFVASVDDVSLQCAICVLYSSYPLVARKTQMTYPYPFIHAPPVAQFVARRARNARPRVQRAARARRQVSRLVPAALAARPPVWSSRTGSALRHSIATS